MATENIVSKKYRILSDVANKVWDVISFFTLAKDVELTNGKNLETTCGSITGITSSLTSTSTTMAASASAIKQLNDKIADLNSNLTDIAVIHSESVDKATISYTFAQAVKKAIVFAVMHKDAINANISLSTTDCISTLLAEVKEGINYNGYAPAICYLLENITNGSTVTVNTDGKRTKIIIIKIA